MRQATGARLARAAAVLAVIAGVLAMHGLATGHHGGAAAPLAPVLAAAAPAVDGHLHAAGHQHAEGGSAADAAAPHDCDLACQAGEHGLALLCVAVLLATAAGAAVLRRRAGVFLPARTGPPPPWQPRSTAPRRRFDLVAELCVSRT